MRLLRTLRVVALIASVGWASAVWGQSCNWMVAGVGEPKYVGDAPEHTLLCRQTYYLSHNDYYFVADWVVERLTPRQVVGLVTRKIGKNPFKSDPDLAVGARAELEDYKASGYDRGHMAPAADSKSDLEAYQATFYLSNMAPQVGQKFNRQIWAWLESMVRDWACEMGDIFVVTGPVYGAGDEVNTIGATGVAVPTGFFKVVYNPNRKRAIAFLLPNKSIEVQKKEFRAAIEEYIVDVQEVEIASGLKLFSMLSKRDKNRIRRTKSVLWASRGGCARE